MLEAYAGKTVLAVGAHPDDLEIGIGGTLALLRNAGARVIMAVVSTPNLLETRVAESERSARILGGEFTLLWKDQCRRVEDLKTYEVVGALDRLVRDHRPAALFCHGSADLHKDHLLVYEACLASQRLLPMDMYCYYPTSCRPMPVRFHPQAYINITDTIDLKMEAIAAHGSQFTARGLDIEIFRQLAQVQGRMVGVPYAEGLEVVRMRLA